MRWYDPRQLGLSGLLTGLAILLLAALAVYGTRVVIAPSDPPAHRAEAPEPK